MTDATKVQIGGSHYKTMAIQPLELGYANQYDACAYSAIKYVSRHRAKDGIEGLKKARHCLLFRVEMLAARGPAYCKQVIPIQEYIKANRFTGREATILNNIHYWASEPLGQHRNLSDAYTAETIVQQIDMLIADCYPQQEKTE